VRVRSVAAALLLAWPLAQLIPWPEPVLRVVSPERAADLARFAAAGVEVPRSLSLYPYATLRAAAALAGLVALFGAASGRYWLLAVITAAGLVEAAIGWRQYSWALAGLEETIDPRGTFGNRNLLAAWLVGSYGAALGLWSEAHGWRRTIAAASAAALAASAVLTFSRMGTLAVLAASAVFALRGRRIGWIAAALAAALAGASGLPDRFRPESLASERQGRLPMWRDGAAAARRYWFAGAGVGAFPEAFRRSHPFLTGQRVDHPHSDYLEILVEWGVPAGGALIAGLAALLVTRWRRAASGAARGCVAGAAGILLHGTADFPLHSPATAGLAALLLGLAGEKRATWKPAAALCGVLWVAVWALGGWDVEKHYAAGRAAFEVGRIEEAERVFRRGVAANPYAAPLWMELALAAEAKGDREGAVRYAGLALAVEPHTERIRRQAGELHLRLAESYE
jgi:tetratricopeptide (TPR) repeat protein